jgi:hypothetical protein
MSKCRIVVKFSDGSKKEYATLEEWRAETQQAKLVKEPAKLAELSEAKTLSRKFKRLKRK